MIGETISHYKILEKLGEGGMGVVYKAEDMKLDRFVALKFLPKGIEADDTEKARFLQEAKAASALNHPNVCIIHDIAEEDDQQFIVMEYVDGVTLGHKLKDAPLKMKDIIEWAIQVGEALKAAHKKGIIHRDIKSDNIMINTENQVKVMDFGLAKLKGSLKLTKASSTVGTLAYMSPEQIKGEETDARMDIFSFGVVLYEMLAGRLPFREEYDSALMYSILNTEPEPVTNYRSDLSSGFSFLLDKALEKEPDERYQSISETLVDLRRLKRDTSKVSRRIVTEITQVEPMEQGVQDVPVVRPRTFVRAIRKSPLLYGGAVLVVILLIAGYFLWRGEGVPAVPQFTDTKQMTAATGVEDYHTWSPDGRLIALHSNQSGNWDIWVTQAGEGTPVNLTADYTGGDAFPSWSPDGKQIAFISDRDGLGCYVMSSLGKNIRKVASTTRVWFQPQWSPDGKELAFAVSDSSGSYVEIVSLQSSTSRRLLLPGRGNELAGFDLSWSPDGQYFAYCVAGASWRDAVNSQLWLLRVEDEVGFPVTEGKNRDWSPNWSRDGRTLYFVSDRGGTRDLWQQRLGDDGTPKDSPQQLTFGLEMSYARFSPNEKQLAYSKGRTVGNIWRVPIMKDRRATWAEAQQITSEQAKLYGVDVSPDGKQLVFDSERDGKRHLWVMDIEGGEMRRVTTDPMEKLTPRWSSDGREIAFKSAVGGNRDIYVVSVDGGPVRRLTRHEAHDQLVSWSSDGREIAFASNRSGNNDVWIIPAQGGEARQLTVHPAGDGGPKWSPDGKWILFGSNRTGEYRVWKMPAEGGNPELVTEGKGWSGIWSPDGKKVYFMAERDGAWNFWEVSAEGGAERQLTDLPVLIGWTGGGFVGGFVGPATDGKYLYFTFREELGDLWVMDVAENK